MNNFKFKLEKVLDIKIEKEKEIKNEIAKKLKEIEEQNKLLNDLYNKLNFQMKNKSNLNNAIAYKNYTQYIGFIENRISLVEEKIEQLKIDYKRELNNLIKATMEKKAIENLKEREYNRYLLEINQLEQKFNDEYAMYNYFRKKGGM